MQNVHRSQNTLSPFNSVLQKITVINSKYGRTGVRGLTTGIATLPSRCIQEPLVVRDRHGRLQEDPLAVHCFCVCSWSAQFGDLLGVSRSVECDSTCPVLS